jgi:hypothetical protein
MTTTSTRDAPVRDTYARVWHLITAAVVLFAVTMQLSLVIADVNIGFGDGPTPLNRRIIEFFSYFTIQANILVGIATGMLAVNPQRNSAPWRVLRVASMFGITVTLLIYHVLLSSLAVFEGMAAVSNIALHYVVPILAIIGWLVFGPRDRITGKTLIWAAIWPAAYMVYTYFHGALSGFYPYPFVNVERLGLGTVLVNAVGITVLLVAVGALYWLLDRLLIRLSLGLSRRRSMSLR